MMGNIQQIGARYVPKFADPIEWDKESEYEALTVVSYYGTSYTSKKPVPAGVDIGDAAYWAQTGNYNAMIGVNQKAIEATQSELKELEIAIGFGVVSIKAYGAKGDGATDDTKAFQEAIADPIVNTIVIPAGKYVINGSVAIPDNITLQFNSGKIVVNGVFSCGRIVAPKVTIFEGDGTLTISNLTEVGYPEWFNDDVIKCYEHFNIIELAPKDYFIDRQFLITKPNTKIYGIVAPYYGAYKARFVVINDGRVIVGDVAGRVINNFPRSIELSNFTIDQQTPTANALQVYGVIGGIFRNMLFTGNNLAQVVYCTKTVDTKFIDCVSFVNRAENAALTHFYMTDEGNPIAAGGNASLRFIRCNASTGGYPGGIGWQSVGIIADTHLINCEGAGCGVNFNGQTVSPASYNNIIIANCVFDGVPDNVIVLALPNAGNVSITGTYMALAANTDRACLQYFGGDLNILVDDCQFVSPTANGMGFQSLGKTCGRVSAGVNGPATPYSISGNKDNLQLSLWNKGQLVQ